MSKVYKAWWYLDGDSDVWPMDVVGDGLSIEALVIPVRYEDGRRVDERYVRECGTCHVECFDDGVDEALDGEWISYAPPTWYLSCGHEVYGTDKPHYCSTCGARIEG